MLVWCSLMITHDYDHIAKGLYMIMMKDIGYCNRHSILSLPWDLTLPITQAFWIFEYSKLNNCQQFFSWKRFLMSLWMCSSSIGPAPRKTGYWILHLKTGDIVTLKFGYWISLTEKGILGSLKFGYWPLGYYLRHVMYFCCRCCGKLGYQVFEIWILGYWTPGCRTLSISVWPALAWTSEAAKVVLKLCQ